MRIVPQFATRVLFLLLTLAGASASVAAQDVEVQMVRFNNVRAPNGASGTWLESDITLNVKPATGNPTQIVSRVQVALLLGFELPALPGGERRLEHYRAEAECVALEPGRANVRFYLPPELVKRDQLRGDPKYWGVELTIGGHAVTAARAAYAATLPGAEQRKNFQARGGQAAAPNDGILLPQFLTPFANEYARATPSFVRREAR